MRPRSTAYSAPPWPHAIATPPAPWPITAFSFLFDPTLDATNRRAEHTLRPAVVTRTMCGGGNRTPRGAQTQQVLASILRTAQQRGLDSTAVIVAALQAPRPVVVAPIAPTR